MVEITRIENADALEDRAILDCIQALAAEERRLRAVDGAVDDDRLAEIGTNLEELWALLRTRRAAREAGLAPASLVQT